MIFDVHTHAFPEKIAERAIEKLTYASGGLKPSYNGTLEGLKNSMRENGVDGFAILNIATNSGQMKNVNDFAASCKGENIVPFGSVHPDAPDAVEELSRIKELGLRGVKLHPDYQDFFVDDERMFPIYKEISKLGLCVIFHAGQDYGFHSPFHCTPERMVKALKHLDCNVICAHWGALSMGEDVLKYLCGLPLYFDTSFGYGTKPRAEAIDIVEKHGTDKLLFGSDSPWHTPKEEMRLLKTLGLSDAEMSDICWNNAARLFSLRQ